MTEDLKNLNHGYIFHWILLFFSVIFKLLFVLLFGYVGCVFGYLSCIFIFIDYCFHKKLGKDFPSAAFFYAAIANCVYFLYVGLNNIILAVDPESYFVLLVLDILALLATIAVLAGEIVFCVLIQKRLEYEPLVCFFFFK